jgi:ABC-type cobalamin/Fe3+-siderophores transport system ATPase subunit
MSTLSPHTLLTRAVFGLSTTFTRPLSRSARTLTQSQSLLARIDAARPLIPHSTLILLSGPSGSGKSTLLRALRTLLADRSPPPILNLSHPPLPDSRRILIDDIAQRTHFAWQRIALALTRIGLAQPELWLTPCSRLSDGERSRALLAQSLLTLQATSPRPTLLVDEFLSLLDRPCALAALSGLRRLLSDHPGTLLIAASAHQDLATSLDSSASLVTHLDHCRATVLFLFPSSR